MDVCHVGGVRDCRKWRIRNTPKVRWSRIVLSGVSLAHAVIEECHGSKRSTCIGRGISCICCHLYCYLYLVAISMSGNVPRRRRGQSLLLTPVSDSGEATETTSTVSLRAAANAKKQSRTRENQSQGSSFSVPRSTSSPLIYQRTRAPSGSSSSDILALPRSHSNLVQLQHHFRLLPSQIQPRQPLVQPAFSISGPYSGSDADDDDYDQEEGPPQLLVRRTTSQTRIASPLVPLSMTHRRAPAEPEDDPVSMPTQKFCL